MSSVVPAVVLPPPGPKVVQIAVWGSFGGNEVIYALRDDGTIWRGAHDRIPSELVWRQVPVIDDSAAAGLVEGFTFGPPQPAEASVPAAEPIEEQQW